MYKQVDIHCYLTLLAFSQSFSLCLSVFPPCSGDVIHRRGVSGTLLLTTLSFINYLDDGLPKLDSVAPLMQTLPLLISPYYHEAKSHFFIYPFTLLQL